MSNNTSENILDSMSQFWYETSFQYAHWLAKEN